MGSIFDGTLSMNPLPWLQEKSLGALQSATRLVDLANEKDTTPWYSEKLREIAEGLIGRLGPIVVLLHQADEEAAAGQALSPIVERGSFALAAWCKKHDIADPSEREFRLLAQERDAGDVAKKNAAPENDEDAEDELDERARSARLSVYAAGCRRLLRDDLPEPTRRFYLWALSHLELAEPGDVVVLNKRFLPTDIDVSRDAAASAYEDLWERGYVERAEVSPSRTDALPIRLLGGMADGSKHPLPFQNEEFGYDGARIGGKPTSGNTYSILLPDPLARAVARWNKLADEDLQKLQKELQGELGEDRVYLERVTINATDEGVALRVSLRCTWGEKDAEVEARLQQVSVQWLRARLAL